MSQEYLAAIAIVVAIGSAMLALWASLEQRRIAADQNRLQRRVVELEEARERDRLDDQRRAEVSAVIDTGAGRAELVVVNAGPAPARKVWVLIDGVTPQLHQQFRRGDHLLGRDLGPGGRMAIALLVHDGMKRVFDVQLRWADGSSEERKWESTLTV